MASRDDVEIFAFSVNITEEDLSVVAGRSQNISIRMKFGLKMNVMCFCRSEFVVSLYLRYKFRRHAPLKAWSAHSYSTSWAPIDLEKRLQRSLRVWPFSTKPFPFRFPIHFDARGSSDVSCCSILLYYTIPRENFECNNVVGFLSCRLIKWDNNSKWIECE